MSFADLAAASFSDFGNEEKSDLPSAAELKEKKVQQSLNKIKIMITRSDENNEESINIDNVDYSPSALEEIFQILRTKGYKIQDNYDGSTDITW